jgi:hypothetical protein
MMSAAGFDQATMTKAIQQLGAVSGKAEVMQMLLSVGQKLGEDKFVGGGGPGGASAPQRRAGQGPDRGTEKDETFVQRYLSGGAAENQGNERPSHAGLRERSVKKKIRVGITTAHANDVPSVLWSNGIYQNIVYLALLMQKLPDVEVNLVCYPFGDMPVHPIGSCFKIPTINTHEDALKLDVIIELGIRLELDFTPLPRPRGKLVSYMAGNSMVMNFESVFLDGPASARGSVIKPDRFDAVWITPQHMHTNAKVTQMIGGPVEEAPHIWAPTAIEHAKSSMGIDPVFKRPETWSLATFDPNINVVKSFHIPLLVAEAAHQKEPDQIRRMMLFCTEHLKGRPHFESYISGLTLGKATKSRRKPGTASSPC